MCTAVQFSLDWTQLLSWSSAKIFQLGHSRSVQPDFACQLKDEEPKPTPLKSLWIEYPNAALAECCLKEQSSMDWITCSILVEISYSRPAGAGAAQLSGEDDKIIAWGGIVLGLIWHSLYHYQIGVLAPLRAANGISAWLPHPLALMQWLAACQPLAQVPRPGHPSLIDLLLILGEVLSTPQRSFKTNAKEGTGSRWLL